MPRKSRDAEDYDKLKKLGFEFHSPVDEFSSQPDSGSSTGGIIGMQEHGIVGDISTEEVINEVVSRSDAVVDLEDEFGGTSEWTATHAMNEGELIEKREDKSNIPTSKKKTRSFIRH